MNQKVTSKKGAPIRNIPSEVLSPSDWAYFAFFITLTAFFLTAFIFWTIIPFRQMHDYLSYLQTGRIQKIHQSDSIFFPYTYSQRVIRYEYLRHLEEGAADVRHIPLLDNAIEKMKESVEIEGYSPYQYIRLSRALEKKVEILHDPSFYKQAEAYYQKGITLSPTRQEAIYALGLSLIRQGKPRAKEAISILKGGLDKTIPVSYFYLALAEFNSGTETYSDSLEHLEYFFNQVPVNPDMKVARDLYEKLFRFYYAEKDKPRLIAVGTRLASFGGEGVAVYRQLIDSVNHDIYPPVDFK
ncbi:MAG: hypothetical protein AAB035_05875 [Nitrospirota bacterium]